MKKNTEIYSKVFFTSIKIIKENFLFYMGLSIMLLLFYGMYYMLDTMINNSENPNIILSMIINFLIILIQVGLIKIIINLSLSIDVNYSQLFSNIQYVFNYFFASLFYILIILIGIILFIIPGIILAILFLFYPYIIVQYNNTIIASFRYSLKITKHYFWQVFIIWLVINTIHVVLFTINYWLIVFIIPFTTTFLIQTYFYLQLIHSIKLSIDKEKKGETYGEKQI